jgi:hypothetical protein
MPSIVSSLMPQHPAQAVIASCDDRQGVEGSSTEGHRDQREVYRGERHSGSLNNHSEKLMEPSVASSVYFALLEEKNMKKLAFVIAGLTTLALVAPASAETTIIKKKYDGPRAEMRMHSHDRGLHRGWHRGHTKKVVIIKHGHRHHD